MGGAWLVDFNEAQSTPQQTSPRMASLPWKKQVQEQTQLHKSLESFSLCPLAKTKQNKTKQILHSITVSKQKSLTYHKVKAMDTERGWRIRVTDGNLEMKSRSGQTQALMGSWKIELQAWTKRCMLEHFNRIQQGRDTVVKEAAKWKSGISFTPALTCTQEERKEEGRGLKVRERIVSNAQLRNLNFIFK